jgi:hypothetical protein
MAPPLGETAPPSGARCGRDLLAGALGGSLEAHQAADEGVVSAMRRVGIGARQESVEAMLGQLRGSGGWHRESEPPQTGGSHEDEEASATISDATTR